MVHLVSVIMTLPSWQSHLVSAMLTQAGGALLRNCIRGGARGLLLVRVLQVYARGLRDTWPMRPFAVDLGLGT